MNKKQPKKSDDLTWTDRISEIIKKGCQKQADILEYLKIHYPKLKKRSLRDIQRKLGDEGSSWKILKKIIKVEKDQEEILDLADTINSPSIKKNKKGKTTPPGKFDLSQVKASDMNLDLMKRYLAACFREEIKKPQIGFLQCGFRIIEIENALDLDEDNIDDITLERLDEIVSHIPRPPRDKLKSETSPDDNTKSL